MKKIISMLLALMLICAFCVPAFATYEEPIELVPGESIEISGGNYIIKGDNPGTIIEVKDLILYSGTLTLGPNAYVAVTDNFINYCGTINLFGGCLDIFRTKNLELAELPNMIISTNCCSGVVIGRQRINSLFIKECNHLYEDGVCIACGVVCPHEFGTDGKCIECDVECPHTQTHMGTICDCCGKEIESTSTGSILSQGYPEIVYGIGGLAVGFFAAMLIFRKKKVAVSSTAADDEE